VGESIFLFAPSCVTVSTAGAEEAHASAPVARSRSTTPLESQDAAPSPAWGRADLLG